MYPDYRKYNTFDSWYKDYIKYLKHYYKEDFMDHFERAIVDIAENDINSRNNELTF